MDQLGCKRYCCRRMIMTHVDLIEKLLRLVSLLLACWACWANPYPTGITQLRETVRKLRCKHNFFFFSRIPFSLAQFGAYYRLFKTFHPVNPGSFGDPDPSATPKFFELCHLKIPHKTSILVYSRALQCRV